MKIFFILVMQVSSSRVSGTLPVIDQIAFTFSIQKLQFFQKSLFFHLTRNLDLFPFFQF